MMQFVRKFDVYGIFSIAIVTLAVTLPAQPAASHPHVWVTVETTVLFEANQITGLRHKWTFDEFYTAMAVEGLDINKDGIYSREELAELAQINIEGLKEFRFFTHARLAEKPIGLGPAKDYWLEHAEVAADAEAALSPKVDVLPRTSEIAKSETAQTKTEQKPGVVSRAIDLIFGSAKVSEPNSPAAPKALNLHFTVPFAQPVAPDTPDFTFAVYDTSFYIALDMKRADAVKLGAGAPPNCKLDVGHAEKSADEAKQLGEAFAKQLGSQNFGLAASRPIKLICGPKP